MLLPKLDVVFQELLQFKNSLEIEELWLLDETYSEIQDLLTKLALAS